MTGARFIDLPRWCDTPIGRAVLAEIIANPPETSIRKSDWGNTEYYRGWKRPDVALLKRLHKEWWDANYQNATCLPESPDDLIKRVMSEAIADAADEKRRAA